MTNQERESGPTKVSFNKQILLNCYPEKLLNKTDSSIMAAANRQQRIINSIIDSRKNRSEQRLNENWPPTGFSFDDKITFVGNLFDGSGTKQSIPVQFPKTPEEFESKLFNFLTTGLVSEQIAGDIKPASNEQAKPKTEYEKSCELLDSLVQQTSSRIERNKGDLTTPGTEGFVEKMIDIYRKIHDGYLAQRPQEKDLPTDWKVRFVTELFLMTTSAYGDLQTAGRFHNEILGYNNNHFARRFGSNEYIDVSAYRDFERNKAARLIDIYNIRKINL